MARKKNNPKVEYDHTYPPLNQPLQGGNESEKPKQTAFQAVMSQSQNEKSVIIAPMDRRFSDNDGKTEKLLEDLVIRLGAQIKLSITKMGSLVFDIIGNTRETNEVAKFVIREAFSTQTSKTIHISEKNNKILNDRRFHEKLWRKRYLVLRVDYNRGNIILEGGQKSVQQAEGDIENYFSWNNDSASINLEIPTVFHDFIRGLDFGTIQRILTDSGKYVKASFDEDLITLTGSKICVEKACEKITSFFHSLELSLKRFTLVITQKQQAELRKRFLDITYSSEEVSIAFRVSLNHQHIIDIAGESEKVQKLHDIVLSVMRQFSSSKVFYPYWVSKLFSSYKEAQVLLQNYASKFTYESFPLHEYIEILCDESRMSDATQILSNIISDITADTCYDTLLIPESTVKIMESKDQIKLKTIETSTFTKVFFETNIEKLSIISSPVRHPEYLCIIVGQPQQIKHAKQQIVDLQDFYCSFTTKIIDAPNHLHKYIIGSKGKSLNDCINKFGPNSTVSFGKEILNLDQCTVKGPQDEVDSLSSALIARISDLSSLHYRLSINVPNNIKLILNNQKDSITVLLRNIGMLESLIFPSEASQSDKIILIGKKEVVDRCETVLKERIASLTLSVTKFMPIPENLLPILKDFGDAVLKAVSNDVGGDIHIQLPKNITTKEKLSLFGVSSKVDSAIEIFKKLTSKDSTEYYFDMMNVSNQYIDPLRYSIFNIIGSSGVRVYFPSTVVKGDNYTILMIGNSENIKKVKSTISEKIVQLANTIEKTITIKAEYKKEFLKKRPDELTLVQKISEECGNARISIGDRNSTSDTIIISIKGLQDCVDKCIKVMTDLIKKFESRIEKKYNFNIFDLYSIIGKSKNLLVHTMDQYNVILSISPNYFTSVNENKIEGKCHINVKGLPEDVDKAMLYLNEWKVLTMTVMCPLHVQRTQFSFRSNNFAYLVHDLLVELDLGYNKNPPEEFIVISGISSNVKEASKLIESVCDDNYECRVEVDQKHYNRLIGKQGSFIKKFNSDHEIRMIIPSGRPDDRDVLLFGKKENCMIAIKKLLCYIKDWENIIVKEFEFDPRFKFSLIGPENSNIKKLGKELNVSIRLAPNTDKSDSKRTLHISGLPMAVDSCLLALKNNIESIIDDFEEPCMYQSKNNDYQLDVSRLSNLVYVKPTKLSQKNENLNNNCDTNPPHFTISDVSNPKTAPTGHDDIQRDDQSKFDCDNFPAISS